MLTAKRRIKDARVVCLSLCFRAANGFKTLLKADGALEIHPLVKFEPARGELLAVVYAPEIPDSDSEVADAEEIRSFAHNYLRDHRNLDIQHDLKTLPLSKAYVAESFIIAKGDERFAGWKNYQDKPVGDLTGAWAVVIKIEDETLKEAYRSGVLNGISMFGDSRLEPVIKSETEKTVARLCKRLGLSQLDDEMTPEELKATLAENTKTLVEAIVTAIHPKTPVVKTETPEAVAAKGEPMPVFKGSSTKRADVDAYTVELGTWQVREQLRKAEISGDPKEIAAALAALTKLAKTEPEVNEKEAGIEDADTPEIRVLKSQLWALKKASQQGDAEDTPADKRPNLSKAQKQAALNREAGREIGQFANGVRTPLVAVK